MNNGPGLPLRIRKEKQEDFIVSKIPPQSIELEEVIIGAILIDKTAMVQVADILISEMFYKKDHQIIYDALLNLFNSGNPIDLLTVCDDLRQSGNLALIGGEYYLIQLTQKVSSSAHIEFHTRIVIQQYVQRRLIKLSQNTLEDSYREDNDIFDIISNIEIDLMDIHSVSIKGNGDTNDDIIANAEKRFERAQSGLTVGLEIKFDAFDRFTSGLQPSEFTIIAARPGMGKTSLALIIAYNLAIESQYNGVFFSLEMPKRQLYNKIIAKLTNIPYYRIKTMSLSHDQFTQVIKLYKWFEEESPLKIVDNIQTIPGINKWIKDNKPKWFMIDYIQIMSGDSSISKKAGNREQEVSYFSRSIKAMAKKYDIPAIAMSQLSREVDKTAHHRPRLSNLRESGSLEQDADNVIFILRQAYYDVEMGRTVPEIEKGNTLLDLAKGRDTGVQTFQVHLDMIKLEATDNYLYNDDVDVFEDIGPGSPPLKDKA